MPAGEGKAGIDHLRDAVARGVETESLRRIAREIGMSPSGLQKFLDGARPYDPTRRKLERWYVKEAARGYPEALTPEAARAAIDLLLRDLPAGRRARARAAFVTLLRNLYGVDPPDWLEESARPG